MKNQRLTDRNMEGIKTCKNPLCGKLFVPEHFNDGYCSPDCRAFCRKKQKSESARKNYRLPKKKIVIKTDLSEAIEEAERYRKQRAGLLIKTSRMEYRDRC
jgi:hypothetical protein